MAKSFNKVILLGNIGKAPEIRATANGSTVANLSLATTERDKDSSGNWVDKTEWHSLVAFGRTAEVIRDYVAKGSQLHVSGRLQTQSWNDNATGQKRYKTQILIETMTLLSERGERKEPSPQGSYQKSPSAQLINQSTEISEEEIPF